MMSFNLHNAFFIRRGLFTITDDYQSLIIDAKKHGFISIQKIDNCERASERIKTKVCEGGESCTLVRLIDRQLGILYTIVFIIFNYIKNYIDRRQRNCKKNL